MDLPSATDQQLALAQASYDRCQKAPDFFRVFYNHFLSADPAIPPYFTETRFDRQTRLLQHGISLLLVYAKRPNPHLMERLVERHGPGDLNIPARLYPFFVESFIATVREFDPDCGSATEEAWRTALAPGIALMTETQK